MTQAAQGTAEFIRQTGLIAILRGDFALDQMRRIGEVLLAEAVSVMEVTLNSADALDAIARLQKQFGGRLLIGAGTVRTAPQVEAALNAGAHFIVSPNLDPASIQTSQAHDVLHLPGVFTASEAQAAFALGCRMVKLFPAEALGPAYLRALRAPLDDIEFVPTGGVTAGNLAEYVRAGAVAVGIGSALITGPHQSMDEVQSRAAQLRAAWDEAAHG
jgi:Entner-Doudoroff aldolase